MLIAEFLLLWVQWQPVAFRLIPRQNPDDKIEATILSRMQLPTWKANQIINLLPRTSIISHHSASLTTQVLATSNELERGVLGLPTGSTWSRREPAQTRIRYPDLTQEQPTISGKVEGKSKESRRRTRRREGSGRDGVAWNKGLFGYEPGRKMPG